MNSMKELSHETVVQEVIQIDSPKPAQDAHANPLLVVHSLLRGRYVYAVVLALLGLAIGALAGYRLKKPTYQSTGMLRIRPNLQRILFQTEQSSVMPMFDAYVGSQAALIRSRRVVDLAMLQPQWMDFGRGHTPHNLEAFSGALEVTTPSGQLISVAFVDEDPKAAAAAVKSTIAAYIDLYGAEEGEADAPTMGVLENRREQLSTQLETLSGNIRSIANEFGSSALEQIYQFKLSELNKLESQLRLAELNLAAGRARDAELASANPGERPPEDEIPDEEEISMVRREKRALQRKIDDLMLRFGLQHPAIAEAQLSLTRVTAELNRALALRDMVLRTGASSGVLADGSPLPRTPRLEAAERNIRALYDAVKAETVELGRKNLHIEKLRAEATSVQAALNDTTDRIEQLTLERNVNGRISVISEGEIPLTPFKDKRMQFAAAGGVAGAGIGGALVLLLGLLDRRLLHVSDTQQRFSRNDRMFGVMPELPDHTSDPEQLRDTAHCVHHLRAMLQLRQRDGSRKTFAVTSATAGEGKTTLVAALGTSLALSGSRTLLIDCDLHASTLTERISPEPRGVSNGTRRSSFCDVLDGESVSAAIVPTAVPLLFLLPSAPEAAQRQISPDAMKRILKDARAQFDTVLIDTGPALGTVDATIAGAQADGTLLVLSRGSGRALAERALNLLDSAGAAVEGVIFNRVHWRDLLAYSYSSSTSRVSRRSSPDPARRGVATPLATGAAIEPVISALRTGSSPNHD
jgi:Mrp family chromosome partitioning ATPase/uncharacterized protein involved in exopolysaccharide biosynthesis